MDFDEMSNLFHWIIELHSFPPELPLTQQMVAKKITSVVLEFRFQPDFPFSPPFVRVIRPRFLPFVQGGGGHVTGSGSLCMEALTKHGWRPTFDIANVLLQIRLALCNTDPRPARLDPSQRDYDIMEAVDGYLRASAAHGWRVSHGFRSVRHGC